MSARPPCQLGRLPEALERSTLAIAVLRKTEADPSYLASALGNHGSILRSLGRGPEALVLLEESVKILEDMGDDAEADELATSRMQLALTLHQVRGPKQRVTTLAQLAKSVFQKAGDARKEELAQLDLLLSP